MTTSDRAMQVHLGFKVQKKNQLITVFSSSAYQNLKNQSSLVFASDSQPHPIPP